LTHPEGTLLSPDYPKRYNHGLTCIWEITVEYGNNIEVTVNELDLEHNGDCQFDSLTFSNDKNFTNSIMKLCDSLHTPKVLTSNGHYLYVKFDSDDSNNGRGFNVSYRSVSSPCGGVMVGSKGIISTKDYPTHNYENNQICEWNIRTDPFHSIVFQLIAFDLESSENCSKDVLEIYDPVFKTLLWSGCGSEMPNQTVFLSKRNELNVILRTDDSVAAKGFKANFTDACGARIVVNDTGSITFSRSMEVYNCTWNFIAAEPTKKVTLTFTYVKIFIESEEGCFTKVSVFDGDSEEGALRTSFCGSKTPPAIVSNGNALTVKLNTSSLSFFSEFDIHYSVMDNGERFERMI
jgi:cubilin